MLEELGYEIRVFNLIEKAHSCCYNPFVYIHKQSDVFKLVTQLIKNTNPPGNNSSADPFWEKSEIAIMEAIFFYLWMECPKEEQNFKSVMELLQLASASEDDENQDSDLDIMFRQLEEEKGSDHIACKQYGIYKKAGGKTAKSILISVGVRLSVFNLDEIQDITYTDNISLDTVGDKKTAVYIVIPDDDKAFNFLVSMLYSQLFGELYFQADFGNLKWDNDKISLRSKESLIQHKNKLLQLYEKYGMTKGEKKKLQLKKSINQLMTNVNHEFGIPVPAPNEINKKFVDKYISAMEECLIRISNKTATLKTYLQEWDNINQKIDLIKSSKAEQSLKVKNINKLRIKKQTLKERMEKEYGLRSYRINNQKTEQAFLQEASLLHKELSINSTLYGTKESFYEKTKKISHLQKILKTK